MMFNRFKPSLLTRLSNLIVIQVVFVFSALALVILYPSENKLNQVEFNRLSGKFLSLTSQIEEAVHKNGQSDFVALDSAFLIRGLHQIVASEKLAGAYLFIQRFPDGMPEMAYSYSRTSSQTAIDFSFPFVSNPGLRFQGQELSVKKETLTPVIYDADNLVYYYSFQLGDHAALLATVVQHDLIFSNRNQLIYSLLLLFGVSVLVTLLVIQLLSNRFKEPLKRLINGFEKTSQGEIYYMVESDEKSELGDLARAFNHMSQTLWENDHKIKDSYEHLALTNQLLRESQEFLNTLIDSSPMCIFSALTDGSIKTFNKKASEVFGFTATEALGKAVDELFAGNLKETLTSQHEESDSGSAEILCRRADGTVFPSLTILSPIADREGRIRAYLYLVRDISESKSFQEMMVRLDRYYTRGEMAGDIAHEINNFLAILSGNVELMPLLMKKGDQEKINKKLELMRATVDRIAKFTDGLMDTGEGEIRFLRTDINQLIETVMAFLKPQNRFDSIEIVTNLGQEIPLVELDIPQIQQLLVNLVYNASDALTSRPSGRRITINSSLGSKDGEAAVVVEILDNGPGVLPDKEPLLFKKRFTTKQRGHGIGLITCQRIVDAHGGSISYRKLDGACFTIELPVSQKNPSAVKETSRTGAEAPFA